MNFLAIDVETANADYSSICQIGIAEFKNGQIIDKWSVLINPEDYFDPFNVSIHGIGEKDVKNAPTFKEIYNELKKRIEGEISIHHMPFDRIAINRACETYGLDYLQPKWLDSAKIVRRTWEEFAYSGYGLSNIAKHLNINFEHHDALEDAVAAGMVVKKACEITNLSIEEWFKRVGQPIFLYKKNSSNIYLEGNPEGQLYGENIVFTGSLSIPRSEAGIIASKIGCKVTNSVSKTTTMLVVGFQDTTKLAGYEKSSKHRKAEELIDKGAKIRILSENDFVEICNLHEEN
ncbi:exonuclease domain-containing protein [Flavobacterium granuli]|uniref:DNA polymerase-3 subunit epsilon n=1 Tax=Flavobacterium granuli TaxID=280093 RepID=A0A1M5U831_9FLAO|nr:exonuclease domain-containing protein [Flavobacterium granuli]PRZ19580.1 DNA polymerase-3 subunit epsilon [Flavobacterium granuli]SHH58843.1 DNA polymerase-3 subunit epsilon [Flavobacterium granuli]